MELKIYHNSRCRKSREALQYISENHKEVQVIEYLKEPLTRDEWKAVFEKIGMTPSEIVRTQEALWKSNYKGKNLSEEALLEVLTENPRLIERPIITTQTSGVLARPLEALIHFLKKSGN